MFTAEQYVQSMGGEILKQDGRVLVRISAVAKIGGTEVRYQLVPANGVLAKTSKWRNLTPENQLLMVTQRINAKALASLNAQVREFLIRTHERATDVGIDPATIWTGLLDSTVPVDEQFEALEKRLANAIEKRMEARDAELTRSSVNLAEYPESFPVAQSMKRKFIYIGGPTNSGKTYEALQHLCRAETGVYLAPLRLLALENYERLSKALEETGGKVSLVTGEERRVVEGATHVASTVEMLDTRNRVEVCVIDEIQMLGDRERGSAWTAAVCGAPAETVYLIGALEARAAVEALAKRLGCPLEVRLLQRKSPLSMQDAPVRKVRNLKKGDAVIAFSRRDVLLWRDLITEAGFNVSTVYGALSPEVRRAQAERFSSGESDIVVGTDSIGLGLNLRVERVVFSTSSKYNGIEDEELAPALAQQIAGRAGRYGITEAGYVAGFDEDTHAVVRALLKEKVPSVPVRNFSVAPTLEHLARIADATGEKSLSKLLKRFERNIDGPDGFFVPRITEEQHERAVWLDTLPLTLAEKFTLSLVPISTRVASLQTAWQHWASALANKKVSGLHPASHPIPRNDLQAAEDSCKLFSAYAWLSYRCPEYFPSVDVAQQLARQASDSVDKVLHAQNAGRRKSGFQEMRGLLLTPAPGQAKSAAGKSKGKSTRSQGQRGGQGGKGKGARSGGRARP